MSKYIDADALIRYGKCGTLVYWEDIEGAPSIDIVRCGECKYCHNGQCWKSDGLDKLDGNVADDDFCSRGERSER